MPSYRVVIVGGGPAGLIAAETLAGHGVAVTIYEHRRSVARKFQLAGRGGLNITHAEPVEHFLDRYGSARPVLEPAIRGFDPEDLRRWCADLGEPTFAGTSDRVFPESFRATPLLRSWLRRLDELGVRIETERRWTGWTTKGGLQFDSMVDETADAVLFALGGASWPRVGSDGGWTAPFEAAGITVQPLTAANCGVVVGWSEVVRSRHSGAPVKNACFTVGDRTERGDVVVTDDGLEGGPIYALGPAIRTELGASAADAAELRIDFHPDLTVAALTARLAKRRPKSTVSRWLRSAGVTPVAIDLVRDATANRPPEDAPEMAELLKALPVPIAGLASLDRAISSAGGIALDEVDERYMLRRRPGTFVAGEMLDWEAPTGGYLLQACFSTGVAAAHGILEWLRTDTNAASRSIDTPGVPLSAAGHGEVG